LTGPVLSAFLGGAPADHTLGTSRAVRAELVQRVVAVAYPPDPPRIAALAPVVDAVAASGDEVAGVITARAARALVRSLSSVESRGQAGPVVLAGSLLARNTVVSRGVAAALAHRRPAVTRDAALGAAALALRAVGRPDLHRALVAR
jgi:N-acetylglucosamine kinase-like BadF-type ATPase